VIRNVKRNSIYLESYSNKEIDKKVNDKHPNRKILIAIFSLYELFDKVISVSKYVHEQNRENIKQFIKHSRGKMDYVINAIDYRLILSLANQHADFQYEFAKELNPDISLEYSNVEPMENNKFQASFPM